MRDAISIVFALLLLGFLWGISHKLVQIGNVLIGFRDILHEELRSIAESLDGLRKGLAPTGKELVRAMELGMADLDDLRDDEDNWEIVSSPAVKVPVTTAENAPPAPTVNVAESKARRAPVTSRWAFGAPAKSASRSTVVAASPPVKRAPVTPWGPNESSSASVPESANWSVGFGTSDP